MSLISKDMEETIAIRGKAVRYSGNMIDLNSFLIKVLAVSGYFNLADVGVYGCPCLLWGEFASLAFSPPSV